MVVKNDRINNAGRRQYTLHSDTGEYLGSFEESQSLSRVWSLYKTHGFVTMSACRDEKPEEENLRLMEEMKKEFKRRGLGFWETNGFYQDKKNWIEQEDGSFAPNLSIPLTPELSFFVAYNPKKYSKFEDFVDELRELACDRGKADKYQQDSILAVYSEAKGNLAYFVDADGVYTRMSGKAGLNLDVPDQQLGFYTKLLKGSHKGRNFQVEAVGVRWSTSLYEGGRLLAEHQISPTHVFPQEKI